MRCAVPNTPGQTCQEDADYVIIYSCLQEHIREIPMCNTHTQYWVNRFDDKKWSCTYCPGKTKIEEIFLCLAEEVKEEWLNL